ncbi:MAG: MYXO-CTERM sorting domain-containing protein [Polyangiaceae bacterium]
MTLRLPIFASAIAFTIALFSAAPARAGCVGAADGKCDPAGGEDCSCDDCLKACSGECTASNPPACTFEDACTCEDCWADAACTDPKKDNCKNDGTCDFFLEGCLCDDCASLSNCAGFSAGGSGGAGGGGATGGSGGGGATGGSVGGSTGGGGSGGGGGVTLPKPDNGCGCAVPGTSDNGNLAGLLVAIGAGLLSRRRQKIREAS